MTLPAYAYDLQHSSPPAASEADSQRLRIAANRLSIITGGSQQQRQQLLTTLAGSHGVLHGLLFGQPLQPGKLQQLACSQCEHGRHCKTTLQQYVLQGRCYQRPWWQRPAAEDQQAAERLLRELGLALQAATPLHQLDHAQRELAAIARALASRAPVVLLREPAALDSAQLPPLLTLLRRLAITGRTIVLALADRQLAAKHAQQLLNLDYAPKLAVQHLAA